MPNNPRILKYTTIPGRLNSQVYYEQRLRHSCSVPFEKANDLQIVRTQIVERKCFSIDQKCSSVSSKCGFCVRICVFSFLFTRHNLTKIIVLLIHCCNYV